MVPVQEPLGLRLCVFCGSKLGARPAFAEAAALLGREMAARRIALVYGGGGIGLMGVMAEAAIAAGGHVTGVIPQVLINKELAHPRLDDLRIVADMSERKVLMGRLSQGFITLPGGYGTADELFEMITWQQLGVHRKPSVLVNIEGYFDPLLRFLDGAVASGFLRPEHRRLLHVERDVPSALDWVIAASADGNP